MRRVCDRFRRRQRRYRMDVVRHLNIEMKLGVARIRQIFHSINPQLAVDAGKQVGAPLPVWFGRPHVTNVDEIAPATLDIDMNCLAIRSVFSVRAWIGKKSFTDNAFPQNHRGCGHGAITAREWAVD